MMLQNRSDLCKGEWRKKHKCSRITLISPYIRDSSSYRKPLSVLMSSMYNHIRTVAYWLDASPLLADLGLPFRVSPSTDPSVAVLLMVRLDWTTSYPSCQFTETSSPVYCNCIKFGYASSSVLLERSYSGWSALSSTFAPLADTQLFNVILDVIVGIVPIIGDLIDNLFKSNLRNLALLEDWLLTSKEAERYHILIMPDGAEYLPKPKSASSWSSWFGASGSAAEDVRERERRDGRVTKTRRMRKDEGAESAYTNSASSSGPSSGTRARGRRSDAAPDL